MKLYQYLFLLVIAAAYPACQLVEPEDDNHDTMARVMRDPNYAEGLLDRGYILMPFVDYRFDEVATDDAVSNVRFNNPLLLMGTGTWSSGNNPEDEWTDMNSAIMSINQFLEIVDKVTFRATNLEIDKLFKRRLTGEAYALRGLCKFYLLRHHAGVGSNDQLLGIPIYDKFITTREEFAKPRATFAESVASAYADLDKAMTYLPMDYADISSLNNLPDNYKDATNVDEFNSVCGNITRDRMCGKIILGIKSRLSLLQASTAFNLNNDLDLWKKAADEASVLLNRLGGPAKLDATGHRFYEAAQVTKANGYTFQDEIIWRSRVVSENPKELAYYPPSIFGNGQINPSQNLVEAFPMKNGYPITHASSGFNAANPYANRDSRLDFYIVRDGITMRSTVIKTGSGAGADGLEASSKATRTGYYMRKHLVEATIVESGKSNTQNHYNSWMRYTEIFLNYAEAANEFGGPDYKGTQTYSARDVIAAIRKRAGITQPDAYLASVTDKDAMRELIRNERRLELSFESFRFWDLRRWKSPKMTETVRGVRIEETGGVKSYTNFDVENRKYQDYMFYGPIPKTEVLKYNFIQNKGWD